MENSILIKKKKKIYLENLKAELRRQLHLFSAIPLTYLRLLCLDFFSFVCFCVYFSSTYLLGTHLRIGVQVTSPLYCNFSVFKGR